MSKVFKCILIEDEKPAVEVLENYLNHYRDIELRAHFSNAFYAQDYLKDHLVDILFLDINLPGISGLDFLKGQRNPPLVIITSAYDEHAVEAFDLEVFDYLLKPFSLSRFNRTISRLKSHFNSNTDESQIPLEQLIVKSGNQKVKLNIEDIDYIESQREYLFFHMTEKEKVKSRMTMQEAMEILPKERFTQIHRSFIVNLSKVFTISANQLHLNKKALPIGRSYKEAVNKVWRSL